ncbi:MAG TPA: Ku protein, partial [Ilumatobacteraceae bacterium]|nr:Ku protein [Ilumatobacteraceae bacterium]
MVSIPIKLLPAVKRKSISFNQIDDQTMSRVRYRKVSEATGDEVPNDHIVKGFDLGGENYVLITDSDLAPLQPSKSREINLESFVLVDDINPLMYDSSYLVMPDKTVKPYALLASALDGTRRVGIGR